MTTRRGPRAAATLLAAIASLLIAAAGAAAQAPPQSPFGLSHKKVCGSVPRGVARCHADVVTNAATGAPLATSGPAGYGPPDLRSAYGLGSVSASGGSGQTVAIVDAYDDPNAEADLAVYRSQFGLPACTTANGCFRKVNQNGGTSYPAANASWAQEISLDLDMVSAVCSNCHILLVEASSAYLTDLGAAVNRAATMGATQISNSYGGTEYSSETSDESSYYNHPGIAITVSSGDSGYGVQFPASSRYVTAVGGTTLTRNTSTTRGWSETAWSGAGSGCSALITKPSWQTDTGCTRRTVADVSADADPNTGVAVYDSVSYQGASGWLVFGGTSAAAPIVASFDALVGSAAASAQYHYTHASSYNDIKSGSNGHCRGSYLCTATTGYDGPTGVGSIEGSTVTPPTATTGGTSGVTNNAATLSGTINPQGTATTYHFDHGTTSSYGSTSPATDASVGSDSTSHSVSTGVSGLSADTTYHYRVVATNCGGCASGTTYGADATFTTAGPPVVATGAATSVTQSGATLNGTVNPDGLATTYRFEYGTTTSYGQTSPSPDGSAGSDRSTHAESTSIGGLSPNTTYHYRVVATNTAGTTNGSDQTFTTLSSTAYRDDVLGTAGLAGYWRLGESSGTTAADAKGSNTGTYNGAFTLGQPGAISGDADTAVGLDGSSGYVSTPVNAGGAQGTIEFWAYATDLSVARNAVVYTADNGLSSYSHQLGVRPDGSVRAYLWDGSKRVIDSAAGLVAPNEWHHYALEWVDGSEVDLFVDGVKRGSAALATSWKSGNKVLFGHAAGSSSGLTSSWQGRIDEAAVYNAALPATTIQRHYEGGLGAWGPSAVTGSASSVSPSAATLNGTVNPNGQATTWHFDYGTTTGYGSQTSDQSAGSGTADVAATAALSGLTPGTTYHFRLVATNASGTTDGADQMFTTPPSAYSATILGTSGLTGYWRLGEASGTTATDQTGAHDGAYNGGFTLGQTGAITGDTDTAVGLDGSSGYVSTPVNVGASQGTIEFWAYATDLSVARNAVVYTADTGLSSYSHQVGVRTDGGVRAYLWDGTKRIIDTAGGLVAANSWHYYALTWADGSNATLYVDGASQGTVALGTTWKSGNKVLFGHSAGSGSGLTGWWQGRIDEPALYNSALSAATIQQHYNAGLGL